MEGSRDTTVDYLLEMDRAGRVDFWISENDTGIYNAMNKGLSYARGDYFIFLNSDDYLATGAISSLVSAIKRENADYAFANARLIDKAGAVYGRQKGDIRKVYFGSPYCHQTLLCRVACRDKVRFDESYRITMWSYALDLYLAGLKHVHVDKHLAFFRVGGISTELEADFQT